MPELCKPHSYARLMQTNETIQRRGLVYHETKDGFGPKWYPAEMFRGNGEDEFLMFITTAKAFVTEHDKRSPTELKNEITVSSNNW